MPQHPYLQGADPRQGKAVDSPLCVAGEEHERFRPKVGERSNSSRGDQAVMTANVQSVIRVDAQLLECRRNQ